MQQTKVLEKLKTYIANNVLEGKDIGLDASTPLLEWGILNSLEMVKIVTFMQQEFGVEVPPEQVIAENFKDLEAISGLVVGLKQPG